MQQNLFDQYSCYQHLREFRTQHRGRAVCRWLGHLTTLAILGCSDYRRCPFFERSVVFL